MGIQDEKLFSMQAFGELISISAQVVRSWHKKGLVSTDGTRMVKLEAIKAPGYANGTGKISGLYTSREAYARFVKELNRTEGQIQKSNGVFADGQFAATDSTGWVYLKMDMATARNLCAILPENHWVRDEIRTAIE